MFFHSWRFVPEMNVAVSTEAPVYLSSQSYMADSSLSEEMSQFDFSTGVQSFSINSQNPEGHRRTAVKRVSRLIFLPLVETKCLSLWQLIWSLKTWHYNLILMVIKSFFGMFKLGDRRVKSLPGCNGGSGNGWAQSAWMHGDHDGAHRTHAEEQHNTQNRTSKWNWGREKHTLTSFCPFCLISAG